MWEGHAAATACPCEAAELKSERLHLCRSVGQAVPPAGLRSLQQPMPPLGLEHFHHVPHLLRPLAVGY
jgi:hypothetical protein